MNTIVFLLKGLIKLIELRKAQKQSYLLVSMSCDDYNKYISTKRIRENYDWAYDWHVSYDPSNSED